MLRTIFLGIVLCMGLMECKHFAMTKTDNLPVVNNSDNKMHIFVNYGSFNTKYINSQSNYIDSNSEGSIVQVNKSWDSVLVRYEGVTLIFTEWISSPIRENEKHGSQKVYGYMYLTKAKLDSLGGVITFPDDVTLTE